MGVSFIWIIFHNKYVLPQLGVQNSKNHINNDRNGIYNDFKLGMSAHQNVN